MSHPYRSSRRGIAFALTLVVLATAALVFWAVVRHEPVMAGLRHAADHNHLHSTLLLPVRRDDTAPLATSSLRANSEPFDGPSDVPRIVLIINELGMLGIQTEAAIAAPPQVTLAFNPYGRDLANSIGEARQAGHETLIMLPMEPLDYPRDDPGPLALLTTLSDSDNAERLDRILAEADQSVGIIGQAGAHFLTDTDALEPALATLAQAGLLYVDTIMADDNVSEIASDLNLPVVEIDVVVTGAAFRGAIDQRLLELETIARERGYAVGLADAFPVFLEQLEVWSERLPTRGFVLAPITAIVDNADGQ